MDDAVFVLITEFVNAELKCELLDTLRLALSETIEARDLERLVREVVRLLAASSELVLDPAREPGRDRDRGADRWTSISSSGELEEPSTPPPTSHATSSTIAIVHREATDFSIHPWRIFSAPRPMPRGMSYTPKDKRY